MSAPTSPSRTRRPPLRRLLVAGAAVLAGLGALACGQGTGTTASAAGARAQAASHAALKLIWGPNDLPDGSSAFPTYRRLGVDAVQTQLSWRATARSRPAAPRDPADPAYRWPADLDTMVARAKAARIGVAIMVRQTPDWANGGRGSAQAPNDDRDYADFLRAASARYPHVRWWMIWGEPTRAGNFAPMPRGKATGPRRYARLLDTAYAALKDVSPANRVIGGMTWTLGEVSPSAFVKWMRLPNGRPPRMDLYGHNPFGRRFPNIRDTPYYPGLRDINDVDTLHGEIARAYRGQPGGTPKLWLSEFTVASDHPNRAFDFAVSRKAQARWVTAAYRLADRASYVAGLGWFNLYDEAGRDKRALTNGLMDAKGRPKPAFAAYRRAR